MSGGGPADLFDQDLPDAGAFALAEGAQLRVSGPSLRRSTSILAAGTLLSRLTGFARVVLAAAILGTTGLGDAYTFANNVPNVVLDLLLGGVLSATLIPVFVDELSRRNRREGETGISAIVTATCVALIAGSILLYVATPLVVRFFLLLNHSAERGPELAVGSSLLRWFAPQVFFIGAIVISTAILNARRQFASAAFSPVVCNLIQIGALAVTDVVASSLRIQIFEGDHKAIAVLGVGTTLGYVVQLLVQVPAMIRSGIRLRLVWKPRHPAVRRVLNLSSWVIGVVVTNQISFNVITLVAVGTPGKYIVYQTAYQFFQLPYALFAVSIASAIMPDLAERWSHGDRVGFERHLISGLRSILALLIPAAAGFAMVAGSVVLLAAHHGRVDAHQADLIGSTLAVFCIGLPGFSAFLPLMRAYQAIQDTRSMFFLYALENALTIVLTFALHPFLGVKGLALAWSLPYTLFALVAMWHLRRKIGTLGGSFTVRTVVRVLVATGVMVVFVEGFGRMLPAGLGDSTLVIRLAVQVPVGVVVYLVVVKWLGVSELDPMLSVMGKVLGAGRGRSDMSNHSPAHRRR